MSKISNYKVAICIPYHKKLKLLQRLIESIKKQTFKEYIVIITDDSNDILAEKYVKSLGEQFVYIQNKIKKGPTANCNYAMKCCQKYSPEYIKVMHHDDYFYSSDSLEIMVNALDGDDALLVFTDNIIVQDGMKEFERHVDEKQIFKLEDNIFNLICGNVIGAPSGTLVRNQNIYMDENLIWMVDVEWYLKLLQDCNHFIHISLPLIAIDISSDRVTNYCLKNMDLIEREYIYIFVKHYQIHTNEIFETIISKCIRNYDGKQETGFYSRSDYLAILKDAIQDNKKFCLWIDDSYNSGIEEKLSDLGIQIQYVYIERNIEFVNTNKQEITMKEMADKKIICIICKKNAKEIRIKLNHQGINAIPLIEKYL